MKRIVYSIFTENLKEHISASNFKKQQFIKYKDKIISCQKKYAHSCNSSYKLFDVKSTDYDNIQFKKLYILEKLSKEYDEILYIDFDLLPLTNKNIFENLDTNYIHALVVNKNDEHFNMLNKIKNVDNMNVFIKTCAKNAMLMIDDINSKKGLINTGVIFAGKEVINKLKLLKRFKKADKIFNIAKNDNIYFDEICNKWFKNNEVYFSYVVEKYKIPFKDIGIKWNYVFTDIDEHKIPSSAYFIHLISKKFETCLE
tara:strand:+ start:1139 stop:1906 length:768 start_codon:yes stop_codon:yes gene_type:complete